MTRFKARKANWEEKCHENEDKNLKQVGQPSGQKWPITNIGNTMLDAR
jgi:hypothetical protein